MEWDLKSENSLSESCHHISLNEDIVIFNKEEEEKIIDINNFIIKSEDTNLLDFDSSDYLLYNNNNSPNIKEECKKSLLFKITKPKEANSNCINSEIAKYYLDNTKFNIIDNNRKINDKSSLNSPSSQIPNFSGLSYIEKIRKKKEMQKIKVLLDKKTKRNFCFSNEYKPDKITEKTIKYNKKFLDEIKLEIKKMRNRVSAQVSRDRKKKEILELKNLNQNLIEEKNRLELELLEKDQEIKSYRDTLKLLCPKCKEALNKKKEENSKDNREKRLRYIKKKESIISGVFTFALLCLFSSILIGRTQGTSTPIQQQRLLKDNNNIPLKHNESTINSTQIDNYDNNIFNSTNSVNSIHSAEDFLIPKDLQLYLNNKYSFDDNITIKKIHTHPSFNIKNIKDHSLPNNNMILEKEGLSLVVNSIADKTPIFLCEKIPKKTINSIGSKLFNTIKIKKTI